ncbi:hypothetical protein CR513_46114, partial [Mucuna pruriens]
DQDEIFLKASRENSTIPQIKTYEEERLKKKYKVITFLHSKFVDHIFTKVMDLETLKQVCDKIQNEFKTSNGAKFVRLLTLKKEFELTKMKDNESVKDYSRKLMDVMNQMRLLGEAFIDKKNCIKNHDFSCDLQTLTITELTNKLHVQEKRVSMRNGEVVEEKESFLLVLIAKEPTMLKKIVGIKINLFFIVIFAINMVIVKVLQSQEEKHGCTSQMTKFLSFFTSIDRFIQSKVKLAIGEIVHAKGKGTIFISTKKCMIIVIIVLCIPKLD